MSDIKITEHHTRSFRAELESDDIELILTQWFRREIGAPILNQRISFEWGYGQMPSATLSVEVDVSGE